MKQGFGSGGTWEGHVYWRIVPPNGNGSKCRFRLSSALTLAMITWKKFLIWNSFLNASVGHWKRCGGSHVARYTDGFRERRALGHLSFWVPTQVWPMWPFVWKAWKYAPHMCGPPSKIYFLLCRIWIYNCVRSSTEIKAFPTLF